MACLWAKDPPNFEDLLPPDEDEVAEPISPDEKLMLKLDTVMTTAGGGIAAPETQQAPELDAFREKMWRLMGIAGTT